MKKNEILHVTKMKDESKKFIKEREWENYHSPKNVALGICIESNELMENFHWIDEKSSFEINKDQKKLQNIKDELGDILHYIIRLADLLDIDLEEAYWNKFSKIISKYPANIVKGSSKMYEELHLKGNE